MQNKHIFRPLAVAAVLFFSLSSCENNTGTADTTAAEKTEAVKTAGVSTVDMAQLRAEIQAVETQWAEAMNTKNFDGLMSMYADDAVSMQNDGPMVKGKEAIRQMVEKGRAAWPEGGVISFATMDVYGDANTATEVGTSTMKDARGNVLSTGKYMGVFQKKDGKWLCIREIYNEDKKMP